MQQDAEKRERKSSGTSKVVYEDDEYELTVQYHQQQQQTQLTTISAVAEATTKATIVNIRVPVGLKPEFVARPDQQLHGTWRQLPVDRQGFQVEVY